MPGLHLPTSGCLLRLGLVLLLTVLCGCNTLQIRREKKQQESVATPKRLQREVMRFADQYSGVIAQGLDDFATAVGTSDARAQAAMRKAGQGSAAITIGSGPNPFANLLDMVVLVTTTRISQENFWVNKVYGDQGRPLLVLLQTQETDIWELATNYLSPDQLQQLHSLIEDWQKRFPEQRYTAFLHFTQFADMLGVNTEQTSARRGSIFSLLRLDPFAGLDPAIQQIEQSRNLAERAIYYGQRLPTLLKWQGESMFFTLTATPEIQDMLSYSERWTKTVEQIPTLVTREREAAINQFLQGVARERTNIINNLIAQERQATNLLTNLRETLEVGRETSLSLDELAQSADTLLQRYQEGRQKSAASTNKRPFDIREYGATFSEATAMATQLNLLLASSDQSLKKLEQTGKQFTTHIFLLALLFLLAIVAAMLLYRFLARALFGPRRPGNTTGQG